MQDQYSAGFLVKKVNEKILELAWVNTYEISGYSIDFSECIMETNEIKFNKECSFLVEISAINELLSVI